MHGSVEVVGVLVRLPGVVVEGLEVVIEAFDGQNWEANAAGLAHLSKEHA